MLLLFFQLTFNKLLKVKLWIHTYIHKSKLLTVLLVTFFSLVFSHPGYTKQETLKTDTGFSSTDSLLNTQPTPIEFSPLEKGLRVQLNGIHPDDIQDITLDQQSIYDYTMDGATNGDVIIETDGHNTTLDYDLSSGDFLTDGNAPLLGIALNNGDMLFKPINVYGNDNVGHEKMLLHVLRWVWQASARRWVLTTRVGTFIASNRLKSVPSWPWIEKYGIVNYNYGQALTRGFNGVIQAHHLVPRVFSPALNQNAKKVLSIILTKGDHNAVSGWWAREITKYVGGAKKMNQAQIREAFRKVYKDYPEILKLEEILFRPHG
ncbi:MAG: hypothetical protein V3U87_11485 [Methylococcaceae bacterium]